MNNLSELQELREIRDRYNKMLSQQAQYERSCVSVANRRAWDEVLSFQKKRIFNYLVNDLLKLVNLVQDPKLFPDRPTPSQVSNARFLANSLQHKLESIREDLPTQLEELRRVLEEVKQSGRQLHRKYGVSDGSFCKCDGCELIRSVYGSMGQEEE